MASSLDSGFIYQPQFSEDRESTFVDFYPNCSDPGGIFTTPTFENFRVLIDRANDFLRGNPGWEIKTCESVEFKAGNHPENMHYFEYGKTKNYYIRGLRLWLTARKPEREKVQQIFYLNLVPEIVAGGEGIFSSPVFESLDDVVARYNEMIRIRPLQGRIITIESQEMRMANNVADPDESFWVDPGRIGTRFLFIIRIFFEVSDEVYDEQIGFADFAPANIEVAGLFSHPKYEPFSNVMQKASDWCAQQPYIRICNINSLEIKLKRGGEVNSRRMNYFEGYKRITCFLRIIRVAFTQPRTPAEGGGFMGIMCKTIVPIQLKATLCSQEFESLTQTKYRAFAWLKATGARLISAETSALRLYTGGEAKQGSEASYTYNPGERGEYWFYVFRLYLSGYSQEPPPEMFPPIPECQRGGCCNIS